MRDLKLALSLIAKDTGSKALRQALSGIQQQTTANKKAEDEAARSREQSAQSGIRAARSLQQEYQRSASARSTLGIRSEREIQREIAQTQAAYNRLLRTGTLTVNEQTRAFRAMTSQVAQLRGELTGAGQSMSRLERGRMWGANATAVAGGLTAAAAVVAPSVSNQMNYEERLAMMANTAFAERDTSGRRAGMQSMDQLIRRSVSVGGGTKETAAETLDTLLASGAVTYDSAEKLLPTLQKYSTATGADTKNLAMIAIRLKQTFGVGDNDIPKALNMAISAGQAGSFELADMAKFLPAQLANASNAGMKGLDDFATVLGLNQAAAITAGSSDQAGTNVTQLLAKITSQDAANAAARIKINGKGIDLPNSLVAAQGKGMNAIDAFSAIVDRIVASNPEYRKLEKKLATATDGTTRQQIMASQAKVLEGSSVGQIIADQQALMALVAYRSNRQYAYDVRDSANIQRHLELGRTAGEQNFDLIQGTNRYRVNQLNNTRDFAQMDAVQPLSEILGKLSGELTDYAGAYPGLTKAMASAEMAIKAMTAAAWVFAGLQFLSKSGSATPSQAPVPPGATPAPAVGGGIWGGLTKLFGAGMSATAIATFTTRDEDEEIANGPAKWEALRARYGQDRIDRARQLYQPWYQFGKGYANENEAWLAQLDKDELAGTVPSPKADDYSVRRSRFNSDQTYKALPSWLDQDDAGSTFQRGDNTGLNPPAVDVYATRRARYNPDQLEQDWKRYQPAKWPDNADSQENDALWLQQGHDDLPAERDAWWASPAGITIPQTANGYAIPPYMQTPAPPVAFPPINITTQLQVDGRTLAETVNEVNGQSATRGPQGGPF